MRNNKFTVTSTLNNHYFPNFSMVSKLVPTEIHTTGNSISEIKEVELEFYDVEGNSILNEKDDKKICFTIIFENNKGAFIDFKEIPIEHIRFQLFNLGLNITPISKYKITVCFKAYDMTGKEIIPWQGDYEVSENWE